ncbi:MAG TPA: response regulator [Kofleriaceae bacterium]|nr:response regulator [Kofleriaceae bacterium]
MTGNADGRVTNLVLVDDDAVDVMNVRRALQRVHSSIRLHVAGDGIEALALLRGGTVPVDRRLLLLDINMPRMNGLELLRELRADPDLQSTPVVVLTTSGDEQDRREAYRLNVAGYMIKPVTAVAFFELMAALDRYWSLVELP